MPPDATTRHYYLDWLRIIAFGLLILYHVGMVYVPWGFHIKSTPTWPALEPWMRLTNPWRMGLIFVISGFATALMMGRPRLLRERSLRLLLPLVFGMLVIVVPQAFEEARQRYGFEGSLLAFAAHYYTADQGFCDARGCLILPTWNHLWFLPYLWLYTTVAILWQRRASGQALASRADRWANAPLLWLLVLPILWLALVRGVLLPRFPESHTLVDDPLAHAVYGTMFAFGLWLGRDPGRVDRLLPLRWPALLLALAAWAVLSIANHHGLRAATLDPALRAGWMLLYATQQWGAILAAFGFARRYLNHEHRWRQPLTEAVFPLYILHQTLIVVLAVALWKLALPLGLEVTLLIGLTVAGSLLGWRLARRVSWLRPWLGMAPN